MKEAVWFYMLLIFIFFSQPLLGESTLEPKDQWQIRLMPYAYMPSIDADSEVGRLSGSVDLDFCDVLDYLDFTAMGRVEAWKGPWGLTFDGLFMNLAADGSFQGQRAGVVFDLDADVRLGVADFALAYRLLDQQWNQSAQRVFFEPYAGLRYAYLRQKIDLNAAIPEVGSIGTRIGHSEDWVEPFVGGRIGWDLNETIGFDIRADAGGFGIGSASDLLWQIAGEINYRLSESTSLNIGYRVIDLDYDQGSGPDRLGIDMRATGPFVGLTLEF